MSHRRHLPVGKLPPRLLETLLASIPQPKSSQLVVGPRFGEDAAVIAFGTKYLVAKTDPITFATERIGWYVVNINANDLATLGARPRWFLATLLLPEKSSTAALARSTFQDVLRACRALDVTLCGGHTEITSGLDRPVVVGQMLGEVGKSRLVKKETQRPGDVVILTKGVAIEGTAILAREKTAMLAKTAGGAVVRRAARLLFNPGISVVCDAMLAVRHAEVHAMHDPTEGGLAAGLYELARAGRVGLRVWKDRVPIIPETRTFSEILGFDPLALIASGALLVVASSRSAPRLLRAYSRRHISAAVIGEVCPEREGLTIIEGGRARRLKVPARDEIARLLGE